MKLRELAENYGKVITEDSCPIHIFNELDKVEIDKIDYCYKIGKKLILYCKQDDCEECWNMEVRLERKGKYQLIEEG